MNELQQPSQPGMEWRILLAVALSIVVLFGAQYLARRYFPSAEAPSEPARPLERTAVEPPSAAPIERPAAEASRGSDTAGQGGQWSFENDVLRLVISSRRGGLRSLRLLDYADQGGEPLELVPQGLPEDASRPLEVTLLDSVYADVLKDAVYEVSRSPGKISPGEGLEMVFRRGDLEVTRRIDFPESGYVVQVEDGVRVGGREVGHALSLGTGLGEGSRGVGSDFASPAVVYYSQGAERSSASDVGEGLRRSAAARWVASDSQYFSIAALAPQGIVGVTARMVDVSPAGENPEEAAEKKAEMLFAAAEVEPGAAVSVFAGPKRPELLRSVDATLPDLIDYGWLSVLVKPLVWALKGVNGSIGNFGFSIIILTFLINAALFPVRFKQMASMRKMSEVQPQVKAIQDKYKKMKRDDPRRTKMNEEVMGLYREKGVNPLGGCLPLLLQFPFLLSFYRMLASSIELRGAPFIFWIQDLSRPDPYYVTPLVMGATMVLQQRMTPSAADPMQQKIMMLLPVFFTFLFLNVSSGLAIYFLFSNLFGMLFQFGYKRLSGEAPPTPAKGKRRKKG